MFRRLINYFMLRNLKKRHRDGYHWLRHTTISPEYKLAKWCAARQGWVGGPNKGILELSSMSWHSVDQLI